MKKVLSVTLVLLLLSLSFFAIDADTPDVNAGIAITMQTGASVLLEQPTAMRFGVRVDKIDYDKLMSNATVTVEMLIIPTETLGDTSFTKEALDARGAIYTNIVLEKAVNEDTADADGYYLFCGVIPDIAEDDYEVEYSAVAYMTLKPANEEWTIVYASYSEADLSRSLARVVKSASADADAELTDSDRKLMGDIMESVRLANAGDCYLPDIFEEKP